MNDEFVKTILIPGEQIKYSYLSSETNYANLIATIILFIAGTSSFTGFLTLGTVEWIITAFFFFIFSIAYLLKIKEKDFVVVTNFRVMEIHQSLFDRLFFGKSKLTSFEDLHYEHLESVKIGTPTLKPLQFYLGVLLLSIGSVLWGIIDEGIISKTETLFKIVAILLISFGAIYLVMSLPSRKPAVSLTSVSGWIMYLPQSKADEKLVETIIKESRAFISYGAVY